MSEERRGGGGGGGGRSEADSCRWKILGLIFIGVSH